MSDSVPEKLPEALLTDACLVRTIISFLPFFRRDACRLAGGSDTLYKKNLIIPVSLHRVELASLIPPPFRIPHDCPDYTEIFLRSSAGVEVRDTNLAEDITSIIPDNGFIELLAPATLLTDSDFYQGYLRIPVSRRRFFFSRIRQKISISRKTLNVCYTDKKINACLKIKASPARPFSRGDELPVILNQGSIFFEFMKKTLNVKISESVHRYAVNKIQHAGIQEIHRTSGISGFVYNLLGIEIKDNPELQGYFFPDMVELSQTVREIPITSCQYRREKQGIAS